MEHHHKSAKRVQLAIMRLPNGNMFIKILLSTPSYCFGWMDITAVYFSCTLSLVLESSGVEAGDLKEI
jgi:hypothetical protein